MKYIGQILLIGFVNIAVIQGADNAGECNQISKQLLKNHMKWLTIPMVRQKMHEAEQEVAVQNKKPEGNMAYIKPTYIWFNKSFATDGTDQLAKAILNRVHVIETSPHFQDKKHIGTNGEIILATPKRIDKFTRYGRATTEDGTQVIVTTTEITDKEFIEAVIREVEECNN